MRLTRTTSRKRFIEQVLVEAAGTPLVLEELRWRVMQMELGSENRPAGTMTESYRKSFNRSLRSFLPTLAPAPCIHKIASNQGWTAGLLARVAVYRLDDYALLDRFLSSKSVSVHFWINARTKDVWQEGYDGEVEVQSESMLPVNAPNRIEPIHYTRGGWPRSGPKRRQDLAALGPKWKKRPLVCAKICTRAIEAPVQGDVLAIVRLPTNLPLSVIGPEPLEEPRLRELGAVPWTLYLRRRGATLAIPSGQRIV
jgi:hypothetical protein